MDRRVAQLASSSPPTSLTDNTTSPAKVSIKSQCYGTSIIHLTHTNVGTRKAARQRGGGWRRRSQLPGRNRSQRPRANFFKRRQARPEASVRVLGTTTVRAHRPNLKIWAVRSTAAPLLAPNPPSCRRWQTAGLEVDCGLSALPPRRFRVVTLLNVRHPASLGPGRAQTPLAVPRQ